MAQKIYYSEEELLKIRERYAGMKAQLDAGKSAGDILRAELGLQFPQMTEEAIGQDVRAYLECSKAFQEALDDNRQPGEILRQRLEDSVQGMTDEQALRFLKAVRYLQQAATAEVISSAANDGKLPDLEEIQKQMESFCSGKSAQEQIEELVLDIQGNDGMELLLMAGESCLLREKVMTGSEKDVPVQVKSVMAERMNTASERALYACAVHIEAKRGNIAAMPADISAAAAAAFAAAGAETARVNAELAEGTLDESGAESRLRKIAAAVEAALIVGLNLLLDYAAFMTVALLLGAVLGNGLAAMITTIAVAGAVVFIINDDAEETSEQLVEGGKCLVRFLGRVAGIVARKVGSLLEKGKEMGRKAVSTIRTINA